MADNTSNGLKLTLGAEYPRENEPVIVAKMIQQMQDQLEDLYKTTQTLRQVHSKMHGCVKAEFIVEPNLPAELRVGLFKNAVSYPAWLRLSNGKTKVLPDKQKDTRGFALKLMNVPGEKLLYGSEKDTSHDFVLASSPIFFAKNLDEFHGLMTASISKKKLAIPAYFLGNLKIAIRTVTKLLIGCKHTLGIPYYSVSPYRFGDDSKAVKYVVKPSPDNVLEYTSERDKNYLNTNLVATLAKRDIHYDFYIQFQTDPVAMPIEDGTIEWTSPLIKMATIRIPKQEFNSDKQRTFGENLTYNAWHCSAEHRPLGGFNRGRKAMYESLYKFRHDKNKITQPEPTAGADFLTTNSL
ncbi:MAG: hypothetical protein JWQ38_99 [Flavipsychrobacter sp.]|nr:hypothetical protein [Flavipsychrobacter sp.]